MRALLDVNVLIALFDRRHIHNGLVTRWWAAEQSHGWASCPLTQNGLLRIVSQPSYARPVPLADAVRALGRQIAEGDHQFWPDDISILDHDIVDAARLMGPKQLTDVFLLALAVQHGGRFVTLDRRIGWQAARAATEANLVTLL